MADLWRIGYRREYDRAKLREQARIMRRKGIPFEAVLKAIKRGS